MALSSDSKKRLVIALTDSGAGAEVAASMDVSTLKLKWVLALVNRVHMKADADLLTVTALAGGASQTDVNVRANLLKASLVVHMVEVGSDTVDGAHVAADTANKATLAAVADASGLATAITLISALKDGMAAHFVQSGVHYNNDGTSVAITTDPPVTKAQCITDLNDLLTLAKAHYAAASF